MDFSQTLFFYFPIISTCRFVDKYTELKSRGELDDDALFEETAKALLEDGITLKRRGAPIVSITHTVS